MFFSSKAKGFFIEQCEHAVFLARTSAMEPPLVIEQVKEVPAGDDAAVQAAIKELMGKSGGSGYVQGRAGIYPAHRLVRRVTLDLKRAKEPGYFNEVMTAQFRIEPEKYTMAVLNAGDGSDYDIAKAVQKEVLFCGTTGDELNAAQDKLIELGVYPQRLELGTLSTLAALLGYLHFKQIKTPTLVLEFGSDTTQSFILNSTTGVDISRPIPHGVSSMIPVVQKELGLKDEDSAKKLFYSNTFDFTSLGGKLIGKLLKELQSSIGFYEVQTGQSIGQVFCTMLPPNLGWLHGAVAGGLGVPALAVEPGPWLESLKIKFADSLPAGSIDARWLGLFGLMAAYDAPPAEEKK